MTQSIRKRAHTMRLAINDVELALSCDAILRTPELFETASDEVMVKVPLGVLRQIARSYPALNAIANDPQYDFVEFAP